MSLIQSNTPPEDYLAIIAQMDFKSNFQRREIIEAWLTRHNVPFRRQAYNTGCNLIVDIGAAPKRIAVGSHFDRVDEAGGANDNASAVAVCMEIIQRCSSNDGALPALRIFFFDEEETGLGGSEAYVAENGISDIAGLINMELVGSGDQLAIWPTGENTAGALLQTFEKAADQQGIPSYRFDKIIAHTADHVSFRDAGLADAFTVTSIFDKDLETAAQYYEAMKRGAGADTLYKIISGAPLFQHYHQPTDTVDNLKHESILMTADVIMGTLALWGRAFDM